VAHEVPAPFEQVTNDLGEISGIVVSGDVEAGEVVGHAAVVRGAQARSQRRGVAEITLPDSIGKSNASFRMLMRLLRSHWKPSSTEISGLKNLLERTSPDDSGCRCRPFLNGTRHGLSGRRP
jgi:hypothetical protein